MRMARRRSIKSSREVDQVSDDAIRLGFTNFRWDKPFPLMAEIVHGSNAGRTTDFGDKKSSDFSGEIFRERNFGSSITALQPCSH